MTPSVITEDLAAAKGEETFFINDGENDFTKFKPLVKAKFNNFMKQ